MIDERATDFATEFAKQATFGTPMVVASAWTMNEWLIAVSIFYVLFQTAYLARKWWREERPKRQNPDG